jgi:hypothetical protein
MLILSLWPEPGDLMTFKSARYGHVFFPRMLCFIVVFWFYVFSGVFCMAVSARDKKDPSNCWLTMAIPPLAAVFFPCLLPVRGGLFSPLIYILMIVFTFLFLIFWERIWIHYISRGLTAGKPVLITSGVFAALAVLVWGGSWIYERARLELAIRDAHETGIITELRPLNPIPGEKNAADIIQAFMEKSKGLTNQTKHLEHGKICFHCVRRDEPDILLKTPLAAELSELLSDAAKRRFYLPADFNRDQMSAAQSDIQDAVSFLSERAAALRLDNKNAEAWKELDKALQIAKFLNWGLESRTGYMSALCDIADAAGAGDSAAGDTERWENLLRECLASPNPFAKDAPAYELKLWRENKFSEIDRFNIIYALPSGNLSQKNAVVCALAAPRMLSDAASWLRCNNTRAALADEINITGRLSPDTPASKKHRAAWPACAGMFEDKDSALDSFIIYKNMLNMRTLKLALNIYRAGYGVYPEKLEALVPELLPVIPADLKDPTGKIIYNRKDDSFTLAIERNNNKTSNGGVK